jgi:oligopeptidase A
MLAIGLILFLTCVLQPIIQAADGEVEVWNKDVRFFNIRSSDGDKILASFYLDPFSRPKEKNGGAWMNVCVNRSRFLGPVEMKGLRIPVAYLVCNQSPPVREINYLGAIDM